MPEVVGVVAKEMRGIEDGKNKGCWGVKLDQVGRAKKESRVTVLSNRELAWGLREHA